MAASVKRVVGWMNREEWEQVYDELFSGDSTKQRHALDKISVWKFRLVNRLSTAVECSSQLVNAMLQEQDCLSRGEKCDEQLRLTYGMAIVRFVNLLTEKGQTGAQVIPLHVVAQKVGVAQWLVDMRHDTTHSNLPSLSMLRAAAQHALSWIKNEYWDAEYNILRPKQAKRRRVSKDNEEPAECVSLIPAIRKHFSSFLVTQLALFEKGDAAFWTVCKQHSSFAPDFKATALHNRKDVVQILMQDDYLMSRDQLNTLGIDPEVLLQSAGLQLPDVLVALWRPLLWLLHTAHITPLLIDSLISAIDEGNSLRNRLLAGWAATIVTAIGDANSRQVGSSPVGSHSLYKKGCALDGTSLLQLCLQSPNQYTTPLLDVIAPLCQLSLLQTQRLRQLTRLYDTRHDTPGSLRRGAETHLYSVQTLLHTGSDSGDVESLQVGNNLTRESAEGDVWQIAADIDWSQYPIGCFPGGHIGYTDLELLQEVGEIDGSVSHAARTTSVESTTKQNHSHVISDEDHPAIVDNHSKIQLLIENDDHSKTPFWTEDEMIRIEESIELF